VGAAGLDDVLELGGFGLEGVFEPAECGQEVVGRLAERRQVDGRGEDVV
jgi:hypothetical protein